MQEYFAEYPSTPFQAVVESARGAVDLVINEEALWRGQTRPTRRSRYLNSANPGNLSDKHLRTLHAEIP